MLVRLLNAIDSDDYETIKQILDKMERIKQILDKMEGEKENE